MKEEDTPGLAMSRSLGDGLAHNLGVSSEPGKYSISPQKKEVDLFLRS